MIKLIKNKKPKILVDNENQWTKDYLECLKSGIENNTALYRYNNNEIKKALEIETHGKCAYCESKIKHIGFGDIEHILPKNKNARPELVVDWNNLTLACEYCNRKCKKDYYSIDDPLINPYVDSPDDFLFFAGSLVFSRNQNSKGQISVKVLDLNRAELVVRRSECLERIDELLYEWKTQTNKNYKNVLSSELKKETSNDKEYSAFVKHYLISVGFPID
ncbi:MAG: HNH endonuclease [Firmicutes bacterium]|nr:HNH endonuclease [Candidatus Colivicinus equi]